MVFDPENLTANAREHGQKEFLLQALVGESFGIASQGERLTRGLQTCAFLRRPDTEEDTLLYGFGGAMSIVHYIFEKLFLHHKRV